MERTTLGHPRLFLRRRSVSSSPSSLRPRPSFRRPPLREAGWSTASVWASLSANTLSRASSACA
eukprot:853831-Prorocentrum_lima.AAC.1